MAQFLRPDSDITTTNITGSYTAIDETSASNTDFIESNGTGTSTFECGLSNTSGTPASGSRIVRYVVAELDDATSTPDNTGGPADLTASLHEGSNTIATDTQRSGDGSWTQYSFTLTAPQVASIVNYDNLSFRVVINDVTGGPPGDRARYGLSWMEMEIPNPVDDVGTANNGGVESATNSETATFNYRFLATANNGGVESATVANTATFNYRFLATANNAEIQSATNVDTPTAVHRWVLSANNGGVESATEVDQPTIGQVHNVTANNGGVESVTNSETATFNYRFLATANNSGIESATNVDNPTAVHRWVLSANNGGVESATSVDPPLNLGQVHNLPAANNGGVESATSVDPALNLGQVHNLAAANNGGVESATQVDTATFNYRFLATANNGGVESATDTESGTFLQDHNLTVNNAGIESSSTSRSPVLIDNAAIEGFRSYTANILYSLSATSSLTPTYTMYSPDTNCLVLNLTFQAGNTIAPASKTYTVTYGGQSLTSPVTLNPANDSFVSAVFYLMNPPSGNNVLSVTTNDEFRNITGTILELSGVRSANPVANVQTASATTVAITPESSNSIIVGVQTQREDGQGGVTPSAGNIEIADFAGGGA